MPDQQNQSPEPSRGRPSRGRPKRPSLARPSATPTRPGRSASRQAGSRNGSPSRPSGRGPSPPWRATPPAGPNNQANSSVRGPRGSGGPRNQWVMLAVVVAVLLAINLWVSSAALSPNRVQISYSPTFITQLNRGNVSSISSTSLAVQGTFKKAYRYQGNTPTIYFSTQIPQFAVPPHVRRVAEQRARQDHRPEPQRRPVDHREHPVRFRADDRCWCCCSSSSSGAQPAAAAPAG